MKVFHHFDLTEFNSYRIKAFCKEAYFPETDDDIMYLYNSERTNKKILIGSGHNIILSKEYYDEDFIIFSNNYNNISLIDDNCIIAEAGTNMIQLSQFAFDKRLSGLEIFYDIPSSFGGAIVMNAGASGEEIKDLLVKVWYYDPHKNAFNEISKEEIGFEYRNSFFQKNPGFIITKGQLQLKHAEADVISEKMERIKAARWAKQPKDFPNAGSVFKRPPGRFVGPMIDELGLKGFICGGAKISEKHSGFIINYNNATGNDIINLIKSVKQKVFEKFGVNLEVEQRII